MSSQSLLMDLQHDLVKTAGLPVERAVRQSSFIGSFLKRETSSTHGNWYLQQVPVFLWKRLAVLICKTNGMSSTINRHMQVEEIEHKRNWIL
ncbi:hypothetical protein [Domibacillus sp. PGB-M46]|uniref:hypothetical protein n=1 Tax=Domibacillus sp. PGB-M46 TaxID=2910255 RepID=UPI001F581587|nr:hypothetical protein [Domibacillus sp. PGB-M46]